MMLTEMPEGLAAVSGLNLSDVLDDQKVEKIGKQRNLCPGKSASAQRNVHLENLGLENLEILDAFARLELLLGLSDVGL